MDTSGVNVTVVRRETRARWLLVVAVLAVLLATPVVLANRPVHAATVGLDALYARMIASGSQPYQGYAVSAGAANLPTLPDLASVIALLDGETTLRVWYAAPDRWRVDTITTDGERDLYQAPTGQSIWDSANEQLITITGGPPPVRLPRGPDLTPPDLARRLLTASAASGVPAATRSALGNQRIAGLDTAGIRITPNDPDTTIGRIDIWADPTSGLPVKVEVTTRGASTPVLVSRFLQVSLTTPAAATIAVPTVPPGAGSTAITDQDVTDELTNVSGGRLPRTLAGEARVDVKGAAIPALAAYGAGLRQFIAVTLPGSIALDWYNAAAGAGAVITDVSPPVSVFATPSSSSINGFILTEAAYIHIATIATPLLSVVIVMDSRDDRGFAFAGTVTPAVLTDAANDLTSWLARDAR